MNLYVGNLSHETSEADLRTLFSEFGEVVSVKILIDTATGLPRGFGFVEMADKFQGFDAIANIDMTYVQGNIINVRESKPKSQQGGSGGYNNNRGGGYGGGDRNRPQRKRIPNSNRESGYNREGNYNRESNYNRDNNYNSERNYNRDNSSSDFSGKSYYNNDDDLNFNKL